MPVCPEDRYYFFESRGYGGEGSDTLAELTRRWVAETFGVDRARPFVAPPQAGDSRYDAALSRPHAKAMDFTGRPMKGMVYVAPEGYATPRDLKMWIEKARQFALSLPAK